MHGRDRQLAEIELADGRVIKIDALYIGAPTRLNSSIAADLGCGIEEGPQGPIVKTDGKKLTTVPGVYAAGDITRAMHNVTFAAADGVIAGVSVHASMIF